MKQKARLVALMPVSRLVFSARRIQELPTGTVQSNPGGGYKRGYVDGKRQAYLRSVLLGLIVCYAPEELAEAAGLFAGLLYVGAGLWVEGWPVELLEFQGAGKMDYAQVWRVRTMFLRDKSYLLEIGPADEVSVVAHPEPPRVKAA